MPDSQQVVRYGRDEFLQHEAPADGVVNAGDLVETTAAGIGSHATAAGIMDRVLVALDDRDTGMELDDTYDDGENAKYIAASGGGVHLRLDAGVTAAEGDRLVSAGNGAVRLLDTAGGDAEAAVVAVAAEDIDNSGGTAPTPIATDVAN